MGAGLSGRLWLQEILGDHLGVSLAPLDNGAVSNSNIVEK